MTEPLPEPTHRPGYAAGGIVRGPTNVLVGCSGCVAYPAAYAAAALERMTSRLRAALEEQARWQRAQQRHLGQQYRRRQLARRRNRRNR